jgi:predicted RNA-binding protein YlxR (DUF448 family)
MRNPRNDAASVTPRASGHRGQRNPATPRPPREPREGPERSCILTRETGARDTLVRLALSPDGDVLPDVHAKAPGRGAWIGVDRAALDAAIAKGRLKGALSRAFKTQAITIPDDLSERIEQALQRAALERLGLEARSGKLVSGGERIVKAARSGQLHALYHASDAGADGAGKLAQAWRVGSDREGSGVRGLELPVGRTILSLALGRENVVHVGVTDRPAASRVGEAIARWLHFIGPVPSSVSCETESQGASAAGTSAAAQTTMKQELE